MRLTLMPKKTYSAAPPDLLAKKLYVDQLGNPQPHPAFVFVK
jgi:hypothetical protein